MNQITSIMLPSVRAALPSLCGVRMDAPGGSFALVGEGRAKSSSDQIRKERTGRARQAAPGEGRAFSCHYTQLFLCSSIEPTEFPLKKK